MSDVESGKPLVLFAEDDPAITEVVTIILEEEGIAVKHISNYDNLMSLIKDSSVKLILLDIMLQGENGADVCKRIKSSEITRHIPIVLVSATTKIEDIAKLAEADDFLRKPFEIDELVSMVKKYTEV